MVLGTSSPDAAVSHHSRARQRLLTAGGAVDTPEGTAKRYAGLVDYFVLDGSDSAQVPEIERLGLTPVTCDLLDPTELSRMLADLCVSAPSGRASGADRSMAGRCAARDLAPGAGAGTAPAPAGLTSRGNNAGMTQTPELFVP